MKQDLPTNVVEDIAIAIVLESATPESKSWNVYLLNEKPIVIHNVIVSSKGYGENNGVQVKTSTLRHFIEELNPKSFKKIEAIDPQVFGLTNEYWLSFYVEGVMYDKKYVFLPESIVDENLIKIPLVNKPGIMIGGAN